MSIQTNKICFILLMGMLLSSCALAPLPAPSASVETLLVLPLKATNTSSAPRYSFYSMYEIKSSDNHETVIRVKMDPSNKLGYELVDSLKPGRYYVDSYVAQPVGAGQFNLARPTWVQEYFNVDKGRITIFPNTLDVTQFDNEKKNTTHTYRHKMVPLTVSYKAEILATLEAEQNFVKWKASKIPEPEGFQTYKTKNKINFRAFAISTTSGRWG